MEIMVRVSASRIEVSYKTDVYFTVSRAEFSFYLKDRF